MTAAMSPLLRLDPQAGIVRCRCDRDRDLSVSHLHDVDDLPRSDHDRVTGERRKGVHRALPHRAVARRAVGIVDLRAVGCGGGGAHRARRRGRRGRRARGRTRGSTTARGDQESENTTGEHHRQHGPHHDTSRRTVLWVATLPHPRMPALLREPAPPVPARAAWRTLATPAGFARDSSTRPPYRARHEHDRALQHEGDESGGIAIVDGQIAAITPYRSQRRRSASPRWSTNARPVLASATAIPRRSGDAAGGPVEAFERLRSRPATARLRPGDRTVCAATQRRDRDRVGMAGSIAA